MGLFWDGDKPTTKRLMPLIPDTGWATPRDLPNLDQARVLSIDTETFDPELAQYGPGWARGKGHLVGVSIATDDGYKWYFPLRHEMESQYNLDPAHVIPWLRHTLARPMPKVGANLLYDIGWLRTENVFVAGELIDVQYAEALLYESRRVALENLAARYLGEHKDSDLLYRWCAEFYGGEATGKQRANIYRAPPRLVGPYAESDADLPLRIIQKQYPLLINNGLLDLFRMECGLINLLVEMRYRGVRVDLNRADHAMHELTIVGSRLESELATMVGFEVNVNAGDSIARAFDHLGLRYFRKQSGRPTFTKEFLSNVEHPIAEKILAIRRVVKNRDTFIRNYIINANVNGRIFGQFHLLRSDDGGTRSGRLSSSTPNLQNIPSRDEELAPLIRGMFLPDYGCQWRKYDYSQIEYRFLLHFAVGPGADEIRAYFNAHPDTDYHERVQQLVLERTGQHIDRKPIKNINFGLIYGMGIPKLSRSLGLSPAEGQALFAAYHSGVPFAAPTMHACSDEAARTGITTTILGRQSHFDLWEPVGKRDDDTPALPYDTALMTYGNIRRAYTHKALNRKLQGSAADLLKRAMWQCWRDGVFDVTGVPLLTVHDELGFSDPGGREYAFREMQHIMETAIPLSVPVKTDPEIGPDWGHVKKAP